jgi:branched-chain amino acid transport system ATP-binding protein
MTDKTDKDTVLTVKDVHTAYIKKEILRGISFSLNKGEIVALLGGNGSGKSTILRTIAGLLKPKKGSILFNGDNVVDKSIHKRQELGIGLLLQGGRIFPNLTVSENLGVALQYRRVNGRHSTKCKIGDIFSELCERASARAGLLSGGERQMLAIEIVLAQRPTLALLDEPTGALSTGLVCRILDRIVEYAADSGCAVLLVEQNVEEAKRISHRCLYLTDGKIEHI